MTLLRFMLAFGCPFLGLAFRDWLIFRTIRDPGEHYYMIVLIRLRYNLAVSLTVAVFGQVLVRILLDWT